jgi:two-component system KDP operon response regulator KdpE
MSRAGRVATNAKLLTAVWGSSCSDQVQYLGTYVNQLRKKIEDDPSNPFYLLTDQYVGYRFIDAMASRDRVESSEIQFGGLNEPQKEALLV